MATSIVQIRMDPVLRDTASKIFEDVATMDQVVIVNKNSRPQNVIISYDRYCRLKESGADI